MRTARVEKIPPCDICSIPAAYDGATRNGPWAFMCENHFKKLGLGLGLGVGQKLVNI